MNVQDITDEIIANHIDKATNKGQHIGYTVRCVSGYNDKNKPIKTTKNFVSINASMEEKLQQAILCAR